MASALKRFACVWLGLMIVMTVIGAWIFVAHHAGEAFRPYGPIAAIAAFSAVWLLPWAAVWALIHFAELQQESDQ